MIRGVVFDMDGTLVQLVLDFPALRQKWDIPAGEYILAWCRRLAEPERTRYYQALQDWELEGARRADIMPGAQALLAELKHRGIPVGVLTRNCRAAANEMFSRLGLACDLLITRDDAPPKPDPLALQPFFDRWQLQPYEMLMVGDYLHDIQQGHACGCPTVLLQGHYDPRDWPQQPDFIVHALGEIITLLDTVFLGRDHGTA